MIELSPNIQSRLLTARDASKGVSTDTRASLQGTMFFALRGANFDGNTFVQNALDQGATHAVTTDRAWEGHDKVTVVENELDAIQGLARAYRRRWACPVLGMTGSNGKTTTKELIRDVLSTTRKVHATLGNLNNHIGVPLTLLNAPADPEFVVVEMGANHQGEIRLLANIAEPTHGYITNIGLAHLEGFGGEEGVYKGKKELFDHLAQHHGTAFVQRSDPQVVRASQKVLAKVDVPTHQWRWTARQGGGGVASCGETSIALNLEGSYNLGNVVAAVTIGAHFGVPMGRACAALSSYVPENHRSQSMMTERNWVILDAYNANPSSMDHALRDFGSRGHNAPLAILGDMAELGAASEESHQNVVETCLQLGVELWTVGAHFGQIFTASETPKWTHFDAMETLLLRLEKEPLRGRQILVKGSRSAALERLVPYL